MISDWKKTYGKDDAALKRIVEYEKLYRYAMEISEFQETSEIPLEDLKRDVPDFVAPQSYIYLDRNPKLLSYIESHIVMKEQNVKHDFSHISSEQVCVM